MNWRNVAIIAVLITTNWLWKNYIFATSTDFETKEDSPELEKIPKFSSGSFRVKNDYQADPSHMTPSTHAQQSFWSNPVTVSERKQLVDNYETDTSSYDYDSDSDSTFNHSM